MAAILRIYVAPLLLLAIAACAGSQSSEAKQPGAAGEETARGEHGLDVQAMLAREIEGLGKHVVQTPGLRAEVLAKAAPSVQSDEHGMQITIPIGTKAPITCLTFREDPDPGALLFNTLERAKKAADLREIKPLPMLVTQEAPVVGVAALYFAKRPDGVAVGELKLLLHARRDHATLCFHDEPGYRASFMKVADSLFESQDRGVRAAELDYVDLVLGHVDDVPAGYDKVEILTDDAGNRKVLTSGLLLFLRSPVDLAATDYASVTTVDRSGIVVDGRYVRSQHEQVTVDITLNRKKGSEYEYAGMFQGNKVSGSLKTKDKRGLVSSLEHDKQVAQRLGRGEAFTIQAEEYDPASDPSKLENRAYIHTKQDLPRVVRLKFDEFEAVGVADEHGRIENGQMNIGPLTLKLKRGFSRGAP